MADKEYVLSIFPNAKLMKYDLESNDPQPYIVILDILGASLEYWGSSPEYAWKRAKDRINDILMRNLEQ